MFKCIEAKDEKLIKEIYRFRYQIACEEEGIFDKNNYPDKYESDKYDEYSIHYAFLDNSNNIAACIRLVHHSKCGYPTPNSLEIYKDEKEKLYGEHDDRVGEISRIFIRKDCRGLKSSKKILDLFKIHVGKKMKEIGVEYTYGALEESFLRFLTIIKIPYKEVGPYKMHGNKLRAPCIMYTDELLELNRELFCEEVL